MTIRHLKERYDPWTDPVWSRNFFGRKIKRSTLRNLSRIEATRWKFCQISARLREEREKLGVEINKRGVAFLYREGQEPLAIKSDGWDLNEDRDYWKNPNKLPKKGHALKRLAEIAKDIEWDAEYKRRLSLVTKDSLALGASFVVTCGRLYNSWEHIRLVNQILSYAVCSLNFLGTAPVHQHREVLVNINARLYAFTVDYCGVRSGAIERWPTPEMQHTHTPANFVIDESYIGMKKDVILTRHGEPPITLATAKRDTRPNVWIYGAQGLRFDRASGEVDKVLTPKEVSSLLKRAK